MRQLSPIFYLAFLFAIFRRRGKTSFTTVSLLWLAFIASSWMPFDFTGVKVADGPRFIKCCPAAPYRDPFATHEKMIRGECMFCSDLVNGFEPKYYLVW